jgi:hypothetical protein
MKYLNIHVARITRTIIEELHDLGMDLPDYGDMSAKAVQVEVEENLRNEGFLASMLEDQYNEVTGKFGCPFSVEEALIMGTYGFDAIPMQALVDGEECLECAIEACFAQTFWDALAEAFGKRPVEEKESPEEPGEPAKAKLEIIS